MQSFLGACNGYPLFIDEYAKVARPLKGYRKKDTDVYWNEPSWEAICDFESLNFQLVEPLNMGLLKPNRLCMIDTETSTYAFSVVLLQQQDDTTPKKGRWIDIEVVT